MADWAVTYPLTIAPLGTNVEDGFEKHVSEIAKIYGHINGLRNASAGTVAPSSPNTSELWLDTSTSPAQLKEYSGGTWNGVSGLHSASHNSGGADELDLSGYSILSLTGGDLTGALNEKMVATALAVATTCDIASATGNVITITGTGTINSFGTAQAGSQRVLKFDNIVTITRNTTSMVLPGSANIVTATGDTALFVSIGTAKWECVNYQKALISPIPDTDGTMAANSDQRIPTQKAVKAYFDDSHTLVTIIQDQKTAGTNGGTFTKDAWRVRDLNAYQVNQIGLAALSSNQFVLGAGTYEIDASVPACDVTQHQAVLYNVTDSANQVIGTSSYDNNGYHSATISRISGVFTLTGNKTFEIRHYSHSTSSGDWGFGYALGQITEVYTNVVLRKLA